MAGLRAALTTTLALDLAIAAQFEEVKPGGDTLCAKGGEYSFFHRTGTLNKVVVEFEQGGACWNALTCVVNALPGGGASCLTGVDKGKAAYLNGPNSGIHDADEQRNPFRDWHHVFVPYCTCDGHTGTKDNTYHGTIWGPGFNWTISGKLNHRGHVNFLAVLEWMKSNFPQSPDVVAITGSSAGSIGALNKWPFLAKAYPNAQHVVFGDSHMGLFTEQQYNEGYSNWGMAWPDWIPGFSTDELSKWHEGMGCYFHSIAANAYPQARLGWFSFDKDIVQTNYFVAGGGDAALWTALMRAEATCIRHNTTNERTFIAAGSMHMPMTSDSFYNVTASGVSLPEWVAGLISGQAESVDCADSGECNRTLSLTTFVV